MIEREPALLVLEDGQIHEGIAWGARGQALGEIVFNTGMTGYQETLTDPSYHRQIVVMTAPHIGNTGVNTEDPESRRIWVAGYVVRDPARRASSWRATGDLPDQLAASGIVAIAEVDTRAITRHLRSGGVMRAGIFSGPALADAAGRAFAVEDLLAIVRGTPPMAGADLAGEVTTDGVYTIEATGRQQAVIAAVDLGIKAMTPHRLAERGARVHVVPRDIGIEELLALKPDGVFFSNGPGDPAAATLEVALARAVLDAGLPVFGICFGNQILGRALGFGTYKLRFGHRGLNQPVKDLATGKVEITSHNHGFAVDVPAGEPVVSLYDGGRYGRVQVSHVDLNDGVVEGIQCLDIPAFSVQYHPEAAAGPHDATYLFDRFLALARGGGDGHEGDGADPLRSNPADAATERAAVREGGADA
jgi:carbamoyl-phosphate synthase small subunit